MKEEVVKKIKRKIFFGKVSPPKEDFRVYIQGEDFKNKEYQRLYPTVYHGKNIWWKFWHLF
jgi:hypothetical protein